ncbi:MAG: nucleotidyltransferase family protein [Anaerolineae bacterium]|nr:nucleotidyltransferase family protein [Anaerolineae bacterium]
MTDQTLEQKPLTLADLRARRREILEIAARHGAGNVRVFGSVVRGEAEADSDVDFLIDIVDMSRFSWGGGGLIMDLQELLGRAVDVTTEKSLHWYLKERILKEAVPL